MKYFLCTFFLLITFYWSDAQFKVVFKLSQVPLQHNKDTIFIASNFNEWNPANRNYFFSAANNNITIDLPGGDYEFKCTRGGWEKVECLPSGKGITNRSLTLQSDTTIELNIEAWKDDFVAMPKLHTASSQVQIMDTAFFIPQLNRSRRIWIYLPEGYAKNNNNYPVMYMQDGQNIFDDFTSAFGEWGVDECLDSLIKLGKPACIVVAIDNGPKRMNEYNPFYFQQFGEGDQYLKFIVENLKPSVDKKYRTLSSKENTIIAGSSMGGLISYYAMLQYPAIFGKAGIFSPAFWIAPDIKLLTDSLAAKINSKFFFYAGEKEGKDYIKNIKDVQESLGKKSSAMVYSLIDTQSNHDEQAWRKWFAEFYIWIMADGYNTVIKIKE